LVCVGLRRIVTVAFLRRVQIFLLTYLLTFSFIVRVYKLYLLTYVQTNTTLSIVEKNTQTHDDSSNNPHSTLNRPRYATTLHLYRQSSHSNQVSLGNVSA